MENNIVWIFYYNPCVCESSPYAESIHRTRKGAEMAMEFHKNEKYKEHLEMLKYTGKTEETWKFGEHESWFVDSREILD